MAKDRSGSDGDATKGGRLRELVYHVEVDDGAVLKLIPPSPTGLILRAFKDKEATQPITDTDPRKAMFLVPLINNVLDAGEAGTVNVSVHCLDQGTTSITARLIADVDQDDLFPTGHSKNGKQQVEVA